MIRLRAVQPEDSAHSDNPRTPALKGYDDFQVSLGDIMRAERATLGKSLLDVQSTLKIKTSYISAIENSDPSAFDVPAFIPGYIRSYARYLGLDPEWVLEKFCEEGNYSLENRFGPVGLGVASHKPELTKFAAQKNDLFKRQNAPFAVKSEGLLSKIDPSAVISSALLGALILAIGYGGWAVLQELQRVHLVQTDQVADSSTPVEPLALAGVPVRSGADEFGSSVPREEDLERLYRRPQPLEVPIVTPRDPPIVTLDPERVATVSEIDIPESEQDVLLVGERNGELTPDTPVQVVEETVEEPVREVILLAVRPSWVRIRSDDGSVLLEKILDGGERYIVPKTEQPPILRTGNAGSVYFLVSGKTYGPLGEGPTVVDDIVMGPEEVAATLELADFADDSKLAEFVVTAAAPEAASEGSR